MPKKLTYRYVKDYVESKGYILLSDNYEGYKIKIIYSDKEGYIYCNIFSSFKLNPSNRFHTSNPYTIQNIKLWCKLNNKPFELIDNQIYQGNDKYLKWQCLKDDCKEIFKSRWSNISTGQGCGVCEGQKQLIKTYKKL